MWRKELNINNENNQNNIENNNENIIIDMINHRPIIPWNIRHNIPTDIVNENENEIKIKKNKKGKGKNKKKHKNACRMGRDDISDHCWQSVLFIEN